MAVVSPHLLSKHVASSAVLSRAVRILESDDEVVELLKMSNVMAVTRLKYNDHGIVHARIVAGAAMELFDLLLEGGVTPTTVRDGTARNAEEAKLVVLLASYLHDVGNSVHRLHHEYVGAYLAKDVLDRLLPDILGARGRRVYAIRQEVLHAIYATEYGTECLTAEAGVVKIADGLDMSEGRARVPYRLGKVDIHAVSALSIKRVEVGRGDRPVRIDVHMDDAAGVFQVEQVLMPKIATSGIQEHVEVYVHAPGRTLRYHPR